MSNLRRSVILILIVLVFVTFAKVESYRERERQRQKTFWKHRQRQRHYRQVPAPPRPGPGMNQQGPPMNQQGPPMYQQGPPMNQQGPPMNQQGPPMNQQGPPMYQQGPPMNQQGPPMNQPGPPMNQQGPPMNQQGPPMNQQGPPMNQQGPPMNQQGPRMSQQGSSSYLSQISQMSQEDSGTLEADLKKKYPELYANSANDKPTDKLLKEFGKTVINYATVMVAFDKYLKVNDPERIVKNADTAAEEQQLDPILKRLKTALITSPPDWESIAASIPSPTPAKIDSLVKEATQNYVKVLQICKKHATALDPQSKRKGMRWQAFGTLHALVDDLEKVEVLVKKNEVLVEEIQDAGKKKERAEAEFALAPASDYNSYSEGGAVEEMDAEADSKDDYGDDKDQRQVQVSERKRILSGAVSCRRSSSGLGPSLIGTILLLYYHYGVI